MTGELDGTRILFNDTDNLLLNSYDTYFKISFSSDAHFKNC